jgi:hypothetical protein
VRAALRFCFPITLGLGAALTVLFPGASPGATRTLNGFTLSSHTVDADEIRQGGPGRDGIPALNDPNFVVAAESSWDDDERVIGLEIGGEARAYPLAVLVWHEIANDTLGGKPVLVTYCPLCGTGMAFSREVEGRARTFGVSGLLYRSDLLLFDRQTDTLWSQISAEAVTGSSQGTRLQLVRSRMLTWREWRAKHPGSTVLTTDTGHRRSYDRSPYGDYSRSGDVMFEAPVDPRYHPKLPTVGLRVPGGASRGYPASEIEAAGGRIEERFEGRPIAIVYHPESRSFEVDAPDDLEVVEGFWFAWAAFHPETSVFTSTSSRDASGEPEP